MSPAGAQCPNDSPLTTLEAEENPLYLQVCHPGLPPGGSCPQPPVPTLVQAGSLPQEFVVEGQVLSDRDATEVRWQAEWQDPTTGVWTPLYQPSWISTQGAPFDPSDTFEFGAPGLVPERVHRIRYATCNDDNCTCWSSWTPATSTSAFTEQGLDPPPSKAGGSPAVLLVEDTFTRPVTDPKCLTASPGAKVGDGLGPRTVWRDCVEPTANQVMWIDEYCESANTSACRTAALAGVTSSMTYLGDLAEGEHTYTDMLFRKDLSFTGGIPEATNLQARTHVQMVQEDGNLVEKGYVAKYSYEIRNCGTSPTMFLARFPDEYDAAACGQPPPPYQNGEPIAFTCPEVLPSDVADGVYADVSEETWIRIQAEYNDARDAPQLDGSFAWGCTDGEPIENCTHLCHNTRWDLDLSSGRALTDGLNSAWGATFHDTQYYVDSFRAGSSQEGVQ